MPTCRATASAVSPWSPVMTTIRMPAGGSRPRRRRRRAGRVLRAPPARGTSGRARPPSRSVPSGASPESRAPPPRARAGPDRPARRTPPARARARRRRAAGRRPRRRTRAQRPSSSSGAPLACSTSCPSGSRSRWTCASGRSRSGTAAGGRSGARPAARRDVQSRFAPATSSADSLGSPPRCQRSPPRCDRRVRAAAAVRRPQQARRRWRAVAARARPPRRPHGHLALGQRAGLVGADDVGRAERLDGGQALDQRAAARHAPDAHREGERDRGQQSLGHVGDDQPDREDRRVGQRQARDERARPRRTATPQAPAISPISRAAWLTWSCSG